MKSDSEGDFQKKIGEKVRALRSDRNFSQESFADEGGLHRTHMSLLERGRVNITVNTLRTITEALDVSLSQFFKGLD